MINNKNVIMKHEVLLKGIGGGTPFARNNPYYSVAQGLFRGP